MRPYRNLKMASVIRKTLNEMFLRDFDFEGALVTIAEVTIDEKLETARVKLAILPFEKGPETYKIIEARRRELQYKLIRKMNVRLVPRLKFEIVQ
jgi:ribosome-binding factor A